MTKQNRPDRLYPVLLFLTAALLMTVGSMTSFLFPLHTGVDQNCFLTVARECLHGKVLYRDIAEQKGPLLYALHLPAAMLPGLRFFGVYLMQILLWTGLLHGFCRLTALLLPESSRRAQLAVSAWSALAIVTAFCYSRGDNAEEFCMLPVVLSLCDLLRAAQQDKLTLSPKLLIKNGVLAGCVLWIKFSMLGFWIGWCLLIGIWIWRDGGFLRALCAGGCFLLGMALTAIPWLIYFAYHGAVREAAEVYFLANATQYPRKITLWQRIADFFCKDLLWNPVMMPLILFGAGAVLRSGRPLRMRLAVPVTLCLLYVFVFIGGVRYRYYLLILGAFVPVGCAAILEILHKLPAQRLGMLRRAGAVLWPVLLLAAGNCLYYLTLPRRSYPQEQFAEIIREKEAPVLLNYGFLDGGFYLVSGAALPDSRYFCKLNIPRSELPEMYEEQERIILEQGADFAVIRWETDEDPAEKYDFAPFFEYYQEVARAEEAHDGYSYALFCLKSELADMNAWRRK